MKDNSSILTSIYWQGKRTEVEKISPPFQTIETINESRVTREKDKLFTQIGLFIKFLIFGLITVFNLSIIMT